MVNNLFRIIVYEYVNLRKVLISMIIGLVFVGGLLICLDESYSHNSNDNNYFQGLETSPQTASSIVIGSTYIFVPQNVRVVTPVDRVINDVASNINVNTPPDQSPNSSKQLIPYMEGARLLNLWIMLI